MGETKTATAAAKAAQARLFTDAFVTTRMDVSRKCGLLPTFLAGHAVAHGLMDLGTPLAIAPGNSL